MGVTISEEIVTVLWENLGIRLPVLGLAVGRVFWVFRLVFELKRVVLFRGLAIFGSRNVGCGRGQRGIGVSTRP